MADLHNVKFVKNVMVPMRDGTRLALDMHVPEGDGPFPLILEYIPYRKDDAMPFTGHHHYFAQRGIIGARLDVRGSGASEGINQDEYVPIEQQDGYDAIEWLAQQPWCSGKIGMFGASYGGFTCVQVATHQPPHLTTIIPVYFTDDRYTDDCHYRGGCLRCYYDIGAYGSSMIGMNAMPTYPEVSGDDWAKVWEDHLENNEPYLLTWLQHQTNDAYWHPGSLRGQYDKVKCSVFMIGGWRDGYPNPPLRTFAHLKVPKKVLIGPWNHARPNAATPGPRIDYLHEVVRWCDHWLKGEQNGVMDESPVCVYVQRYDDPKADRLVTSGHWRQDRGFPTPGAKLQVYYLGADGVLSAGRPAEAGADVYDYRPTVGVCGGLWSGGVPFGLPTDQRPDEVYSLIYTTPPLEEEVEILGWAQAVLNVSSTVEVMAFVARLSDVAPDGTSALVATGVLNGTRRDALDAPKPMTPGEVYELGVVIDCVCWRFEKGHRIRLAVCSSDFPNLWPTPKPGTNRVHRGPGHLSRLTLPVVPLSSGEDQPAFKPADPATQAYQLSPGEAPWEVAQDVLNDRTILRTHTRGSGRSNPTTEIASDARLEVTVSNRDPADAVATGRHHRRIVRVDGVTTVDTNCTLRSTDAAFHVTVDLNLTFNGLQHFQKRWVRTFKRELL